jgi:hypothetical protein
MHIEDFVLFGLLIAAGIVTVLMFFQLIPLLSISALILNARRLPAPLGSGMRDVATRIAHHTRYAESREAAMAAFAKSWRRE